MNEWVFMKKTNLLYNIYDYLIGLNVKPSDIDTANPSGRTVEFDSAYACLVNKKTDCVGRATAFNLFIHLEGISTQGAPDYNEHILSRVVPDGEEYFYDWSNGHPLSKDITGWFSFNASSLAATRTAK